MPWIFHQLRFSIVRLSFFLKWLHPLNLILIHLFFASFTLRANLAVWAINFKYFESRTKRSIDAFSHLVDTEVIIQSKWVFRRIWRCQQGVGWRCWCRWRWSWGNQTRRVGNRRPNVHRRRVTDAFITINRVVISHCFPEINQFWSNHHWFWRCRWAWWASWAAGGWHHLWCLSELQFLILHVQMFQQRVQSILVERWEQWWVQKVLRVRHFTGEIIHFIRPSGISGSDSNVSFDLSTRRLNVVW